MSTTNEDRGNTPKPPAYFRVVGVLAVLWNSMGAFDYFMTWSRNEAYMARFSPELIEWVYSMPGWAVATWGLATWGGLAAAVLLLLRKPMATTAFVVSLLAQVPSNVYTYGLSDRGLELMGTGGAIFSAVIFVVGGLLLVFSQKMARAGILR